MTPRGLVEQARQKQAAAALADAIAELGPPSGWIVVDAEPMAYWLPEGVSIRDPDEAEDAQNETDEVPF